MTITVSATGKADLKTAWDRYRKPALWSSWAPQISRVECVDDVIRPGTRGRVVGPLGVAVLFVIEHVDAEQHAWSWIVTGPFGVRLRLHHSLSAVATGTSTSLAIDGPLPIVLGYAPVARFALGRLVSA